MTYNRVTDFKINRLTRACFSRVVGRLNDRILTIETPRGFVSDPENLWINLLYGLQIP